jgi:phosphoglucosamine mutase
MKNLRKLFGTDGIRGVANRDLTPEFVLRIGKAGARFLSADSKNRKIVVGRDTRPSGDFILNALSSGLLSSGVNVLDAQIMPTPGVALLTKLLDADGGIVISASHNPVEDNGIKFFGKGGKKLTDAQEKAIEDFILGEQREKISGNILSADSKNIENSSHGQASTDEHLNPDNSLHGKKDLSVGRNTILENAYELYTDYLSNFFPPDLSSVKIAIDCANGAAGRLAPMVLARFGANVLSFNTDFGGENINRECGATHPEFISGATVQSGAELGFAYDGDCDRVIACDSRGRIIDGDLMIGFIAMDMAAKGTLKNNSVVTTVMANMGFDKAMAEKDITVYKTDVGDRYVLEKMLEIDSILGGEQSGHIILRNISPTGDGIISTLEFLNVYVNNNYHPDDIFKLIPKFPQVLKNIIVKDKANILSDSSLNSRIEEVSGKLGNSGRILVRPSGTEPLIRVMVEAVTQELAETCAADIIGMISNMDRH